MVRNTRAREYADRKCELEGIKLHLRPEAFLLHPEVHPLAPAPNERSTLPSSSAQHLSTSLCGLQSIKLGFSSWLV
ncbi:hypothetical protein CPC08DRAFT_474738 [Agrocybe pediades]|nr:hypothetical protein CPC08DRAFT_474738 [Agrocybe pediades]